MYIQYSKNYIIVATGYSHNYIVGIILLLCLTYLVLGFFYRKIILETDWKIKPTKLIKLLLAF